MGSGASESSNLRWFLDVSDGLGRVDVLKSVLTESGGSTQLLLNAARGNSSAQGERHDGSGE
jgi:hypothetical protein